MSQPTQPLLTLLNKLKGLLDNGLVTGGYTLTLDELALLVRAFDSDGSVSHIQNSAMEHYQAAASALRETLVTIVDEMRFYVQRGERMPNGDLAKLYHNAMERLTATQGGAYLLQRIQGYVEEITFLKAQLVTANAKTRTVQAAVDDLRSEINRWKMEATTVKTQAAKEVADLQREIDDLRAAGHTVVAANTKHFENEQANHAISDDLGQRLIKLERQLEQAGRRITLRDQYAEVLQGVIAEMIEHYKISDEEVEEHGWTP